MKYYIAYGSNLNKEQMRYRCPDAVPVASGLIDGWKLVFRGSLTGSYCSIIRSEGDCVPVGIWKISEKDERALDRYEGYPAFYGKETVKLRMSEGVREALVYIINPQAQPGIPSDRYVQTCREGYRDFNLPLSQWDAAMDFNTMECGRKRHAKKSV